MKEQPEVIKLTPQEYFAIQANENRKILAEVMEQNLWQTRDMFAAAALTGLLSTGYTPREAAGKAPEFYARIAYKYADAMLAERQKGGE